VITKLSNSFYYIHNYLIFSNYIHCYLNIVSIFAVDFGQN
jgi:hypothetical protein